MEIDEDVDELEDEVVDGVNEFEDFDDMSDWGKIFENWKSFDLWWGCLVVRFLRVGLKGVVLC